MYKGGCINAICFSLILCLLICISLVILYCIKSRLAIFSSATTFGPGHVRGVRLSRVWRSSVFLEHSICKVRGSTLVPAGAPLHNTITTIGTIWIEPVRYWRKAYRLACLNHTVLLQIIMAISPTLHSITVLADDPRGKRKPKSNSTLDRTKKRLSLSIYFKCPTLDIRYE